MSVKDSSYNQDPVRAVDLAADAAAALRRWHFVVRAVPYLLSAKGRSLAILGLLFWYKRVLESTSFADDPAPEGIDALVDELASASTPFEVHRELARARWAIRVAEELVHWRRALATDGPTSLAIQRATDALERVLEEAYAQV
jgi:hypothetical protein